MYKIVGENSASPEKSQITSIRPPRNTRTSTHHQFWREFLTLYKSLPALWDKNCKDYKNRCKRWHAYDKMATKLSEFKPQSKRKDVLRQINILRTNYRRERARAEEARKHCKDYRPNLWYYNLLSFLDSQECVKRLKTSTTDDEIENNATDMTEELDDNIDQYIIYEGVDLMEHNPTGILDDDEDEDNRIYGFFIEHDMENAYQMQEVRNEDLQPINNLEIPANEANIQQFEYVGSMEDGYANSLCDLKGYQELVQSDYVLPDDVFNSDKVYEKHSQELASETNNSNNNNKGVFPLPSNTSEPMTRSIHTMTGNSSIIEPYRFSSAGEILARSWALQYDQMSTQQQIYARKAISDILFAGCMGKLSIQKSSKILSTEAGLR